MKEIALTRGQLALVDDADFEWLNQWKWRAVKDRTTGNFYAARNVFLSDGRQHNVCMHRLILGLEIGDERLGDHRNSCTLDNQRSNLRIATHRQNCSNRRRRHDNGSHYKGVGWNGYSWRSRIMFQGKEIHLGRFSDPILAAIAYDMKASELFGDFAVLNFPKEN